MREHRARSFRDSLNPRLHTPPWGWGRALGVTVAKRIAGLEQMTQAKKKEVAGPSAEGAT